MCCSFLQHFYIDPGYFYSGFIAETAIFGSKFCVDIRESGAQLPPTRSEQRAINKDFIN